ncbi:MAG: phenylalanine--tRNA ligase subunit alpha [Acidobacteriia bacterium]|nr:phenylalanine--tRNA ligase subunit alpha [Terriglobia bacterium]
MNLDEQIRKPLSEIGVTTERQCASLFDQIEALARSDFEAPDAASRLEALRVAWLGRKNGRASFIGDHWLKKASKELKPTVGKRLNSLRALVESELSKAEAAHKSLQSMPGEAGVDLTLPGIAHHFGAQHPLTIVREEIENIFISMGYSVEEGPEIETAYHNFDALNTPENHPARSEQDTFFVRNGGTGRDQLLLRTHTSPVQIRTMLKKKPPIRVIVPGKCYRRDNPDATHMPMFHQVEGLAVDTHITFCEFKGTLEYFLKAFFGAEKKVRFRPSFFPFTEPSAEVDISCGLCEGSGKRRDGSPCRVCKQSGWVEVMGAGMVDPAVFEAVGYDPEIYTGFAFGLGLDRYAMMKLNLPGLESLFGNDVRFLEQFR